MSEERVQKVMSRMGFGSRREIERWIEQGQVKINRKVATLGERVIAGDEVELNGRRALVHLERVSTRVIAYNKPEGEVCSRKDEHDRPTVYRNLPKISNGRWIGIGRLDINTCGLMLFTNDGELANRLMHPSSEIEREYASRVNGAVSEQQLAQLQKKVMLDDGPAHFESILDAGGSGANHWYHVVLKEGRNREVRRLWESQEVRVSRLIRVRYGPVHLPRNLRQRHAVELTPAEVAILAGMVDDKLVADDVAKPETRRATRRAQHTDASNDKTPGRKSTLRKTVAGKSAERESIEHKPTGYKPTGYKSTGHKPTGYKSRGRGAPRNTAQSPPASTHASGESTTRKRSSTRGGKTRNS